jgi:hypothetical protein
MGMKAGDLVHIDIGSHNGSTGEGLKKCRKEARNSAFSQMVEAHREKEEKELRQNMLTLSRDRMAEMKASRERRRSRSPIEGGRIKFKKGSPEAKEHMAKLRAMRKSA